MGVVNAPVLSLGDLLRTGRERLHPEDVGLPAGGARRAKGLRREELALLAGLSVDYLTRLEQGRAHAPSTQVLGALAGALHLDRDEEALLFAAAGLVPPARDTLERTMPPGVARMLERLGDLPIAAFGADWTLLDASALFLRLFALDDPAEGEPMNLAVLTFLEHLGSPVPTGQGDREALEAAIVADLRRSAGHYGADPHLRELLDTLLSGSDRFRRHWAEGRAVPHRSMTKRVEHPAIGVIVLDCDVLVQPGSDVRMVVYSAPAGSAAEAALTRLRVAEGHAPAARAREAAQPS